MIEFKKYMDVPYSFTGCCKIIEFDSIRYYKDGLIHREDGPALLYKGNKEWYINGYLHREDGPAIIYNSGKTYFYYKGNEYDNNFTIKTWKKFIENLKREEELKIFL